MRDIPAHGAEVDALIEENVKMIEGGRALLRHAERLHKERTELSRTIEGLVSEGRLTPQAVQEIKEACGRIERVIAQRASVRRKMV